MATVKDGRLVFACPACDNVIRARPETAGLSGRCVKCGHTFTIPDQSDPVEAPATVVEDRPTESALYPARTKGPPRHPASSPSVADMYQLVGRGLLAVGIFLVFASVAFAFMALASTERRPPVAMFSPISFVSGILFCVSSAPMFAIATLIRDTRTTADCMRHLIDQIDAWKQNQ